MSYKYLDLKKKSGKMILGASAAAIKEFDPLPVALWLITTETHYKNCLIPVQLSDSSASFLVQHEAQALGVLSNLSAPAQLIMEAVLLACEMPAHGDLDRNLSLIAATFTRAKEASLIPVPKMKVKYSVRKQRDTARTKLMTVRGEIISEFGEEAAGLVLSALKGAVGRDLGVGIVISNSYEIFGRGLYDSRPAPTYPDFNAFMMRTMVVDHICKNLTLPYVKDNIGGIKVISDYTESICIRQ